ADELVEILRQRSRQLKADESRVRRPERAVRTRRQLVEPPAELRPVPQAALEPPDVPAAPEREPPHGARLPAAAVRLVVLVLRVHASSVPRPPHRSRRRGADGPTSGTYSPAASARASPIHP